MIAHGRVSWGAKIDTLRPGEQSGPVEQISSGRRDPRCRQSASAQGFGPAVVRNIDFLPPAVQRPERQAAELASAVWHNETHEITVIHLLRHTPGQGCVSFYAAVRDKAAIKAAMHQNMGM